MLPISLSRAPASAAIRQAVMGPNKKGNGKPSA
jgi:hypothetical protein